MDNWIVVEICSRMSDWIVGITVDNNRNIYFTCGRGGLWILEYKSKKPRLLFQEDSTYMQGIVWDGKDTLYICDSVQNRILKYHNEEITTLSGITGQGGHQDGDIKDALFCNPYGITIDNNGDLYVTDYHHIRKINTKEQTVETIAGCTTEFSKNGYRDGYAKQSQFSFPSSIVVKDGCIYVNDKGNHCLRKIEHGMVSTFDGSNQSQGFEQGINSATPLFRFPEGLVLDNYGNLLVLDDDKLHKVNLNYLTVKSHKLKLTGTHSMAMDARGNVFIGSTRLFQAYNTWDTERYLWLAHFKENSSYCALSKLPKDIIRELAAHLVSSIKHSY